MRMNQDPDSTSPCHTANRSLDFNGRASPERSPICPLATSRDVTALFWHGRDSRPCRGSASCCRRCLTARIHTLWPTITRPRYPGGRRSRQCARKAASGRFGRNDVREGEYGEYDGADEEPQQYPRLTRCWTGPHEELYQGPRKKMTPTSSSKAAGEVEGKFAETRAPTHLVQGGGRRGCISPFSANFTPIWTPGITLPSPLASQNTIQKMTVSQAQGTRPSPYTSSNHPSSCLP